jgi:hypothetical protein
MNIFYVAGLLFTISSWALVGVAFLGLWLSPMPIWLGRSMVVLSLVLLAASTVIAYAYATELFVACYGDNAFEWVGYQARVTSIYVAAYWLLVASSFVPQLFWFRRFRSRPLPALIIALAAAVPPAIERVIVSPAP